MKIENKTFLENRSEIGHFYQGHLEQYDTFSKKKKTTDRKILIYVGIHFCKFCTHITHNPNFYVVDFEISNF